MFLRKIVSTFVCLGLFGCFGCVSGMENVKTIAIKEGTFQCDQSIMSYKLEITPSSSRNKINVLCHIQDSSQDGSSSDESGSLSLDIKYKIKNALWVNDAECVDTFLEDVSSKIVSLKGNAPSCDIMNKISDNIFSMKSKIVNTVKQFRKIKDMKGIQNIVFEGLDLNGDFLYCFNRVIIDPLCTIKFTNCKLQGKVTFAEILDSCNVKNLSIINCGLTDDDLINVLRRVGNTDIDTIDVSDNLLTKDVIPELDKRINSRGMSINRGGINLRGNEGITNEDIIQYGMEDLCHV